MRRIIPASVYARRTSYTARWDAVGSQVEIDGRLNPTIAGDQIGHRPPPSWIGILAMFSYMGNDCNIVARRWRDAQSLRPLDTRPGMRAGTRAEPSVSTHGRRDVANVAGAVADGNMRDGDPRDFF